MTSQCPITISSWTLGNQCLFEERCKAASKAGYDGIGLTAEVYVDALNEGLTDQDVLNILKKYQIKCTEVEDIVQWCEPKRSYEEKFKEQICFHMCRLFNVKHINAGLMENYPINYTAKKLAQLCRRAGNLIIAMEPMPYSGLPNLDKTWQVIKKSNQKNAMMLLDSWHWVRAYQPYDLLTKEQAKKVISIQIDDAHNHPYPQAILRDESMHDRIAPGKGVINPGGFVNMIKKAGVKPKVIGVEVPSDSYLAKGISWTAKYTYQEAKKVLEASWPEILN